MKVRTQKRLHANSSSSKVAQKSTVNTTNSFVDRTKNA